MFSASFMINFESRKPLTALLVEAIEDLNLRFFVGLMIKTVSINTVHNKTTRRLTH